MTSTEKFFNIVNVLVIKWKKFTKIYHEFLHFCQSLWRASDPKNSQEIFIFAKACGVLRDHFANHFANQFISYKAFNFNTSQGMRFSKNFIYFFALS